MNEDLAQHLRPVDVSRSVQPPEARMPSDAAIRAHSGYQLVEDSSRSLQLPELNCPSPYSMRNVVMEAAPGEASPNGRPDMVRAQVSKDL